MKKICLFALTAMLFAACNTPNPEVKISVDPNQIASPAEGGYYTVKFTAPAEWTATTDADWLTIVPAAGNAGNTEVSINVAANTETKETTAKVTITAGNEKAEVTVKRAGRGATYIAAEPMLINAVALGGNYQIQVSSNTEWTVSSDASWITCEPESGEGDGEITATIAAAETGDATTAIITISEKGTDRKTQVQVAREGKLVSKYTAMPFSVSATNKVLFSQGNLRYYPSVDKWIFADFQYDIVGESNANISDSYDGVIDLFGWGTGSNPTNISKDFRDYTTFTDWGINSIDNGGNTANQWRTLTKDEWVYLIFTRENADKLFGTGSVKGINGAIILPDNCSLPSDIHFYSCTDKGLVAKGTLYENLNYDTFKHNSFSLQEWQTMEALGAVFLPAAGYRLENMVFKGSPGTAGFYWSSTKDLNYNAYGFEFRTGGIEAKGVMGLEYGAAVRLVKDAE